MRKLIVSMNVTLDGYISGPGSELDWHCKSWTREMGDALCMELAKADTILLGRVTYTAMAKYWPSKLADPSCRDEDAVFANMMNTHKKIVFSTTLSTTKWSNSTLATRSPQHEIHFLKRRTGKHIIVYGSGQLVDSLIASGMVDEYQLWLHPVIIGKGIPLFKASLFQQAKALHLKLVESQKFVCGVMLLNYQTTG